VGGIKYKMNVGWASAVSSAERLKYETQRPHGLRSALTHPTNNCASLLRTKLTSWLGQARGSYKPQRHKEHREPIFF
jgi:hypothetical protein